MKVFESGVLTEEEVLFLRRYQGNPETAEDRAFVAAIIKKCEHSSVAAFQVGLESLMIVGIYQQLRSGDLKRDAWEAMERQGRSARQIAVMGRKIKRSLKFGILTLMKEERDFQLFQRLQSTNQRERRVAWAEARRRRINVSKLRERFGSIAEKRKGKRKRKKQ